MLKRTLFIYHICCYYFIVFPDRSCHTLNHFWVWPRTHHPGSSGRHQVLMVTSRWNGTLFIWSNCLLNHWFCIILRWNWTDLIKSLTNKLTISVWEIASFCSCFVDHAPSNIHQRSALLLGLQSISKWQKGSICLYGLMLNIDGIHWIDWEGLAIWHCWSFEVHSSHILCKIWLRRWSLLSREQSSRLLKSMRCLAFLTTRPKSIPALAYLIMILSISGGPS